MSRSGCEMRIPATVGTSASAVGDFGVDLRRSAATGRTEMRRMALRLVLALVTLVLRLGVSATAATGDVGFLDLVTGAAPNEAVLRGSVEELSFAGSFPLVLCTVAFFVIPS